MRGVISEMKRIAIITVAGISSRFNKGIDEKDKVLKCLYSEGDEKATLLYHMIKKLKYADHIIVVGGYKFEDLKKYVDSSMPSELRSKLRLIYNEHFEDLSSGYSLYLGLKTVFEEFDEAGDVLFAEGDLDIDEPSMDAVIANSTSVLTYNLEPIKANKAVVLYVGADGHYHYAFDSSHGLLSIPSQFSAIYNSGQVWKFHDMKALKAASEAFIEKNRDGTNLFIIQEYLNNIPIGDVSVLPLKCWVNCNTREDYRLISSRWENEDS